MTKPEWIAGPLALVILAGLAPTPRRPAGKPRRTSSKEVGCPVIFTDVAAAAGLKFMHERGGTPAHQLPETMGSGLAWLDYDNDGWMDLYVVQSGPFPPNGSPRAQDRLYRNNGDGTFTDVTEKAGLKDAAYGMGVVAADYDNDGYVDLFVTNFGRNILYHNNGDGTFTDVTEKAGVAGSGWSTSAAFADFDGDGYLDLFVVRYLDYSVEKNYFCGDPVSRRRDYCHPSLYPPIGNRLYRNNGDGTFTDVTEPSGIGKALGKGLGVVVVDVDDDGRPDIYVANDTTMKEPFRRELVGRGSAVADYDNDGDLDIAVSNSGGPLELLRNDGEHGGWIGLVLRGRRSNRQGIGARVTLETEKERQVREVKAGDSYLSSSDPRVHFGLGDATSIRRVVIRWPSGIVQEARGVRPGRYQTIEEPSP